MGIYIFKSKHGPYIKIGHCVKKDPWSRISNRGFFSCICPPLISDKVSANDLELCKWYPSLNYGHEKFFHLKMKDYSVCGEWYNVKHLDNFISYLDELQTEKKMLENDNQIKDESYYTVSIYFRVPYKNKNIFLESLPSNKFLSDIGGFKTTFEEKIKDEILPINKNISSNLSVPSNQGKPWSKEDKNKLIELVKNNINKSDIAKSLGRSNYSIHCQIREVIIKQISKSGYSSAEFVFDKLKYPILQAVWEDIETNYEIIEPLE